jgi:hypothetical protein
LIVELRAGGGTLEEAYLELVAGAGDVAGADGAADGAAHPGAEAGPKAGSGAGA